MPVSIFNNWLMRLKDCVWWKTENTKCSGLSINVVLYKWAKDSVRSHPTPSKHSLTCLRKPRRDLQHFTPHTADLWHFRWCSFPVWQIHMHIHTYIWPTRMKSAYMRKFITQYSQLGPVKLWGFACVLCFSGIIVGCEAKWDYAGKPVLARVWRQWWQQARVYSGGGACIRLCLWGLCGCVSVVAHAHSLVCEVRKEKSGVPQHASTSSSSICPFRSVLHKLKTLYICFGAHC